MQKCLDCQPPLNLIEEEVKEAKSLSAKPLPFANFTVYFTVFMIGVGQTPPFR
jgi:hypothetical protein